MWLAPILVCYSVFIANLVVSFNRRVGFVCVAGRQETKHQHICYSRCSWKTHDQATVTNDTCSALMCALQVRCVWGGWGVSHSEPLTRWSLLSSLRIPLPHSLPHHDVMDYWFNGGKWSYFFSRWLVNYGAAVLYPTWIIKYTWADGNAFTERDNKTNNNYLSWLDLIYHQVEGKMMVKSKALICLSSTAPYWPTATQTYH